VTEENLAGAMSRRQMLLAGGFGAAATAATATGVTALPGVAAAHTPGQGSIYDVKDYGATGAAFPDDTAAIQSAINAAVDAGGGLVWVPKGIYRITAPLVLNGTGSSTAYDRPVIFQGVGDASIILAHDSGDFHPSWAPYDGALVAIGVDGTRVALGAAVAAGARQVNLPPAVAGTVSPGSIIGIEDPSGSPVFGTDAKPHELHKVIAKNGTVVDLDSPLLFAYSASAVAWKLTPVQSPVLRDLAITATNPSLKGIYSIRILRATNLAVDNVTIFNGAGGVILNQVVDGHIDNCTIDRLPRYADAYGYGIAVCGGSANISITGLLGRGTRHLFTTLPESRSDVSWGGPRNVTVVGGIGEGGAPVSATVGPLAIWDTHANGIDISFIGCSAIGVGTTDHSGFQIRARRVRLVDCVAKYNALRGIAVVATEAVDTTISGGEVAYNGESGITPGAKTTISGVEVHHNNARGINWNGGAGSIRVVNCYVHDNVNEGIRDQAAPGSKAPNVVITGNIVPKGSGSFPQATSVHGIGGNGGVVANNILRGYGTGSDGTGGFDTNVVKQNNVVDP